MKNTITIKLRLLFAFGASAILAATASSLTAVELFHRVQGIRRSDAVLLAAIISGVAATVGSFYSALYFQRLVCGGLNRMRERFEDITETLDLSQRSKSPRLDEFGVGAVAFDRLMQRFESTISSVRASADVVARSTAEIAAGNIELSARTEEQAASLQETASSMTRLAETVNENADSAREATVLAANAADVATTGNDMVAAMVETMGNVSESSTRISQITGLIEELAFQTNILALNAAVEAARAGEQGRGFAVVAGEVRSLAQRSAAAAKEIKSVISDSVSGIEKGFQRMVEVSSVMAEIRKAVGRVSEIVSDIAGASEDQRRGIDQVSRAVTQMDVVTQQNAALVEQAAAAAASLDEQALKLKAEIALFTHAEC
ncbi:methyl-accepting chemotaxis protein [Paraburkholderia ferrariae]|uniref:methyl-accepting chemotaxis protein n=1 Tax=Paraburkholderia ferrariae TaxID=386056 RepID=UPI000481D519|nr:methyl-accepting chemotaxis protein [Paraburkholderia ferrariae]